MVKKITCENCAYYSLCGCDEICDGFEGIIDEYDDIYTDMVIEDNRNKYYNDFFNYIENFDD